MKRKTTFCFRNHNFYLKYLHLFIFILYIKLEKYFVIEFFIDVVVFHRKYVGPDETCINLFTGKQENKNNYEY